MFFFLPPRRGRGRGRSPSRHNKENNLQKRKIKVLEDIDNTYTSQSEDGVDGGGLVRDWQFQKKQMGEPVGTEGGSADGELPQSTIMTDVHNPLTASST